MKQIIFSLILFTTFAPTLFAATATQEDLLDYIQNGPKVTQTEWSKPPSSALEKYLEDIANKQNGSQDSNQFRAGETASEYIHRVNIQNKIAETLGYTESVQPDPTVSTTQIPPNGGQIPAPSLSETQRPDINNYMNNSLTKTPTEIKTLNDIVSPSLFEGTPLNKVLNQLFYIGLVAAIILAIVMIIRGGIEYMTVDSINSKESGKKRVQAALGGLVLAFSAILILNTVNPGLTSLNIVFKTLDQITGINFGGLTNGTRTDTGIWTGDPMVGKVGSGFTDKNLEAYTLQKIKEMGFSQLSPADKAAFFPNGGTDEEWMSLVSGIINEESGWDAKNQYADAYGLMQMNGDAVQGYSQFNPNLSNITNEDLYDPYKNIEAGLTVLKRNIERDGYISGPNFTGGARYWAALREESQWKLGKLNAVKNYMKSKGQ
jgi:hypothetical protein